MKRTRIKFCGITTIADALVAADAGVDAIGLVFTRRSRRFVETDAARAIRAALPPFVAAVALFLDDAPDWVAEVVRKVTPDLLQFHGREAAGACRAFGRRYLKAVAMGSVGDVALYAAGYPDAAGFLLDAHTEGAAGGRGEVFDWSRAPHTLGRPLVLAGGLTPDNVGAAVRAVRPWGVDVSSGVELGPGVKDPERMRHFVAAVRAADL